MGDYNSRGGDRQGGRQGDRGDRQMHKATCNGCNKSCEVPFKPTGSKPVFCSNCFREQNSDGRDSGRRDDRRGGGDRGGDRGGYNNRSNDRGGSDRGGYSNRGTDREMHDAICSDCNSKCQVPFRPSGNKPIQCSNCFGGGRDNNSRDAYSKDGQGVRTSRKFEDRAPRKSFSGDVKSSLTEKQIEKLNKKVDKVLRIVYALATAQGLDVSNLRTKEKAAESVKKEVDVEALGEMVSKIQEEV